MILAHGEPTGYRRGMLLTRNLLLSLALLSGAVGLASANGQPGLAVGQKGPEVQLRDQGNTTRLLSKLVQKTPYTALVFYRSADW